MSASLRPGRAPGFCRAGAVVLVLAALLGPFGSPALAQIPATTALPTPTGYPETVTIHTDTGDHVFTVEWAITDADRSRGLMFRTKMAADHGMVFDFFRDTPVSFWMRNTLIPLDMIFIRSDGTVLSIAQNATPMSDTPVPSNGAVRFVLEVNGGTSARLGIDPGDRVDMVILAATP
jgi:uncharacterized membrane protein (UPF0127 family)